MPDGRRTVVAHRGVPYRRPSSARRVSCRSPGPLAERPSGPPTTGTHEDGERRDEELADDKGVEQQLEGHRAPFFREMRPDPIYALTGAEEPKRSLQLDARNPARLAVTNR